MGDDPIATSYDALRAALVRVSDLRDAGFFEQGEWDEYLWTRIAALAVHGWDLRQSIGAGADIDPIFCDQLLFAPVVVRLWPGLEPVEPAVDACAEDRLLASYGRVSQ